MAAAASSVAYGSRKRKVPDDEAKEKREVTRTVSDPDAAPIAQIGGGSLNAKKNKKDKKSQRNKSKKQDGSIVIDDDEVAVAGTLVENVPAGPEQKSFYAQCKLRYVEVTEAFGTVKKAVKLKDIDEGRLANLVTLSLFLIGIE